MSDIDIRRQGRIGRITLTRPKALNALSYPMCTAIETALLDWRDDASIALVVIDAEGDRAFCAGGDIQEMYDTGKAGDFAYGRRFWRDEYRLNALIHDYPKPYVALMQGFVMGGGVGVSCHGSHRVVCAGTRIAMPECGIGLVPDVGGSLLLAQAPGQTGVYLGTTGTRMTPGDAIHAGFADHFIPRDAWPALIETLAQTGDSAAIDAAATPVPEGDERGTLAGHQALIDRHFDRETLADIVRSLSAPPSDPASEPPAHASFRNEAMTALGRVSPLSAAATVQMIRRLAGVTKIAQALDLEYRFTFRAMEHGDFIEGIRAAIIDKDRTPHWRHPGPQAVPASDVEQMLRPLGADALTFERENA